MVLASGETSSESQVPSSVVNSIFRSDFSGSPFFSSFLSVFFFLFLFLLLRGLLPPCTRAQDCLASEEGSGHHRYNGKPHSTTQVGLLRTHTDFLRTFFKCSNWNSRIRNAAGNRLAG